MLERRMSARKEIAGIFTIRKLFGYLPQFLAFAYSTFPLARAVLGLTLLMVLLEFSTLSLMVPLVQGATKGAGTSGGAVIRFWNLAAESLGLPVSQKTWLWLFLVLLATRIIVGYVQLTLNVFVAKQIHATLSDRVMHRVVAQEPLAKIYQKTIGYYVSLAGDETSKAGNIFLAAGQMLGSLMSALAGFAVLLSFSPTAFAVTAMFILVCGLLLLQAMGSVMRLSSQALFLSRSLNTHFIETLNGLRSVRSLSAEKFVVESYRTQIRRYVRILFKIDALNQGYKAAPALILVSIGIVWLWPASSTSGSASPVFFFALTTMLIRILTSLGEFVLAGGKLVVDIRASQDAGQLLGSEVDRGAPGGRAITEQIVRIEVEGVVCGYNGGSAVLKGVNCSFDAGRSYAIIGKSGAGKSTLADILLAMLPISAGAIHVNGIPLTSIDEKSLRSRIILVEQQTRVFTGTLGDNVTVGLAAAEEDIVESLVAAGLGEHLSGLAQGLGTVVDYQGSNISGGQRQRLGITRALIRQPDVLILDECTNAVDPATRTLLVETLRERFSKRILIFITHDPEVIAAVSEVWRFDDGVLVQEPPK
jgi:ABC-type bacteriocin/lantibiotic exporter with double-glycine peptidase domain